MSIRSIPIEEATPDQFRAFAANFLNLDLPADAEDSAVRSAVDRAQPGAVMIFVQDIDEPEAAIEEAPVPLTAEESAGRMAGTLGQGDPRWLVELTVIETEDGSGGRDAVVGVNGRAWQIQRGQPVSLPQRVIEALDHAVSEIIRHDDQGNEVRRNAKRFPYQVHERPTQEQIDAWLERTKAEFCA